MSDNTPDALQTARQNDYFKFKRYAAWTFVVAAPILIAAPPRKLDLNTAALSAAFGISANFLYKDSNPHGRGLVDDLGVKYFGTSPVSTQPTSTSGGVSNLFNTLPTEKAQKIWMGSETENWKEKRLREEQEALDEGKGYGDLIMDHIWEVWNWGKPNDQKKRDELNEKEDSSK
ncbi:hypothetical protein TCE0_015r03089 [Talaromyces pinophilus]|uniref:Uncharacterized protein n=1 Tax=Talaromyces pinophilus TaxID=128442 RepID=A0A6V8H6H8_TALPI|nr:hypothetical protein TCE0_015r03089 [Talaromyces pinophilus]